MGGPGTHQQEFFQEAAKVLKSLRLARLDGGVHGRALLDGGATTSASMRMASKEEVVGLPQRNVRLAVGEKAFYMNDGGTFFTLEKTDPIVAMVDTIE